MKQKILTSLLCSFLLLLGTLQKSDQEDSKAALAAVRMTSSISRLQLTTVFSDQELLTKLKSSQVKVIAAGHVSGQLALFISGSGSKTDFSGGYQVTVGSDPGDGRFDVDSVEKLAGKYSGFGKATDSMFLCSDSDSSSSLIAMNSDNVYAFNLGENKLTPLNIDNDAMAVCYKSGEIFFSSSKPKHYYKLKSGGNVTLFHFDSKTIASATGCSSQNTLGHLCATGKGGDAKITISDSCSGSPPSDITAGYVGDSKAYLFDKDNAVYYFDASIFQGGGQQSVKLTKVPSSQAWFTLASISTANPHGKLLFKNLFFSAIFHFQFFLFTPFRIEHHYQRRYWHQNDYHYRRRRRSPHPVHRCWAPLLLQGRQERRRRRQGEEEGE